MWDERVPIHVDSEFYDVQGFLNGACSLQHFEAEELGDVQGKRLLHLQCHFGLDTLSWARRGAQVTGLDFSTPAIEAARQLAARASLDAKFVVSDVYDARAHLTGDFDVVYTGIGALILAEGLSCLVQCSAFAASSGRLALLGRVPSTRRSLR